MRARSVMVMLAVVTGAASAGCANQGTTTGDSGLRPAPPPYTPESDIAFIDALVPHHEMAVLMADQVMSRGETPEVLEMAAMMRVAQQQEIGLMKQIRQELTGEMETPEPNDPRTQEDLESMQSLTGKTLERAFLANMIPHHASAISMSHRAMPFLDRAELRELARMTVLEQAKESGRMAEMLGMPADFETPPM